MNKEDYQKFVQEGGRTFSLYFEAPLGLFAQQAAEREGRSYKEVFRRAIEEYLRKHHEELYYPREEASNAKMA
jgi:hypothetical protein